MRVLVTGAAGFIGSHIAETMRAAGHEVRGLDSLTPAVHNGRPDHVPADLVVGDVRDPASTTAAAPSEISPASRSARGRSFSEPTIKPMRMWPTFYGT